MRNNQGPHLGVYQTAGETFSVGTYCAYENLFFENVSPSLDGILFHKLILAGGYAEDEGPLKDWIYKREPTELPAGSEKTWTYRMAPYNTEKQFYEKGYSFGHPIIHYSPMTLCGDSFMMNVKLPENRSISRADMTFEKDHATTTMCQLNKWGSCIYRQRSRASYQPPGPFQKPVRTVHFCQRRRYFCPTLYRQHQYP